MVSAMSPSSRPASRYQRRILAWGAGAACLLYVVGAPLYLGRIESDLTDRVTSELTAAGYDGVTVSFSGQTGSIRCATPLGDPRAALDLAYSVRGVRTIEDLPDACRVRTAHEPASATTAVDGSDPVASEATALADTAATTAAASSTSTSAPAVADFGTVLAVLAGNPQFSLLHQLVRDADLGDVLAGEAPVTLFAPTNAAFDALPADAIAQLRNDSELLARVLAHHVVDGRWSSADLTAGPLDTLAADTLAITTGAAGVRVDGAPILDADVMARNGVVHTVGTLLLPDDVDLSAPDLVAATTATFADGGYTLRGVVRSEVERTVLVDAATAAVGADHVVDELEVDPDVGLDAATAQTLATLVPVIADALAGGAATYDGDTIVITGTYVDAAARTAVEQAAEAAGADVALVEQPAATADQAAALEAALNDYVAANPIRFEPSASRLDSSAEPILDELARRVRALTGVAITVEGHTDSDGGAQENLILSQLRAVAVQEALVARGVPAAAVSAEGFGSARPIVVDGVEDKAASRRVEFRVEVR